MKKTIEQDGITYAYCYVKARGTSWSYGYYPESGLIESRAKKRKPTERKRLSNLCLDLWKKIIHKKFNDTCALCGRKYDSGGKRLQMHAHHIIFKGAMPHYKYDVTNGILLCARCHNYGDLSPHNPHHGEVKFREWFAEKYPEWNESIEIMRAGKTVKLDMKKVYAELKRIEREI